MFDDAPSGFLQGLTLSRHLSQEVLALLAGAVLAKQSDPTQSIDFPGLLRKQCEPDTTLANLQSTANALDYVFRCAERAHCSTDELAAALKQLGASVCDSSTIKVIKHIWNTRDASPSSLATAQTDIGVAQLVDWDFHVGMTVQSRYVSNQARPFVTAHLRTSQNQPVSVELSVAQFKELLASVRDVRQAMRMS